jgi:hypothetical protein
MTPQPEWDFEDHYDRTTGPRGSQLETRVSTRARGSPLIDLSLALIYSAAKCARQVSPNSVFLSRGSPTKLTTSDTLKVWRGDARGRREEDYSESHSRTGPRVSSLSGFLVGFRVVPVFELLRRPRLALVLDVFFFN